MKYIKLIITETGKDIGSKEKYTNFNQIIHRFEDVPQAKKYLNERYGNRKRSPIFIDDAKGKEHQIGYIIGFRNQDISHNSKWWNQQDWIEFMKVDEDFVNEKELM